MKRALLEPAERDSVVEIDAAFGKPGPNRFPYTRTVATDLKRQRRDEGKTVAARGCLVKPPLSVQALAERRAELTAAGKAFVARTLTLIDNLAFVKVEKPPDLFRHLRTAPPFEGPFYGKRAT